MDVLESAPQFATAPKTEKLARRDLGCEPGGRLLGHRCDHVCGDQAGRHVMTVMPIPSSVWCPALASWYAASFASVGHHAERFVDGAGSDAPTR